MTPTLRLAVKNNGKNLAPSEGLLSRPPHSWQVFGHERRAWESDEPSGKRENWI